MDTLYNDNYSHRPSSKKTKLEFPSRIRFTQDSISCHFSDGTNIETLFDKIIQNPSFGIDDVEKIEVMSFQGRKWAVRGNRRLYIFKKLEEFGVIGKIPVIEIPFNRYRYNKVKTTENDGESVEVRGTGRSQMEKILQKVFNRYTLPGVEGRRYSARRPISRDIYTHQERAAYVPYQNDENDNNWGIIFVFIMFMMMMLYFKSYF